MKNLKKLLAVVVTVALMATFMVPAFAATSDQDIAKDLGMLKGGDAGFDSAYWAGEPDRVETTLMYLRLLGEGDAAEAYTKTDKNFADAEDHVWGKKVLAYVYANKERLGIIGVGDDKFDPNAKMDAKSYYKIMLQALGFEQDKDFAWSEVLDFAAKQGLTKIASKDAITKNDIATATVEALKAEVKGGEKTLIEKLVADGVITKQAAIAAGLIEDALVAQAKAVGAKKVEVSFNKAVDTAKAVFAIKKGSITVNVSKVEWNEAKTVATITLISNITKGDYTITVGGLEFPEGKNVLAIAAEDEKVAEIEITSDVAPFEKVGSTNVLINYVIRNQYGEDVTASKAGEFEWISTMGTVGDKSTGVKLITGAFKINDIFMITAIHSKAGAASTGTYATKEMKVVDFSRVSKIEALSLYNKDNKQLFTNSVYTDFYIKIEAYDQYGNKVTDLTQLNDKTQVTDIVSNPNVLDKGSFKKISDAEGIGYELKAPAAPAAGKADIYFYSNITGQQTSFTVEVAKPSELDSLILESPADIIVKGEKINIPFTALDQNGAPLSEKDAGALTVGDLTAGKDVSISGPTGGIFTFGYDYVTEKAYLELDLTGATVSKGPSVIFAQTKTHKVSQINIDIKDVANPVAVVGTKDLAILMSVGGTSTVAPKNIQVIDQYGRQMKLDSTWFGKYKLQFTSSAEGKVKFPNVAANAGDPPAINEITAEGGSLVMTGVATGSSTIKVNVYDLAKAEVIANSEYEFAAQTVAKTAITDYKVETPEILHVDDDEIVNPGKYDKAVTVYGLNTSGAKIALNPADYVITTNDTNVTYVTATGKLTASKAIFGTPPAADKEKAITVLTVISVEGGAPVTLANVVTITNKASVLTTLEAKSTTIADEGVAITVKGDVAYVKVADVNAANLKAIIKGKDQYGVAIVPGITNVLVTNFPSTVTVTNNGQLAPTIAGAAKGDTFTVTFITDNGLTKVVNVVVTD
jgi:hypothetical protein